MALVAAEAIVAVIKGEKPGNLVNPEIYWVSRTRGPLSKRPVSGDLKN